MRSISAEGLAKLATNLGTEPISIIEIDWAGNGAPLLYADRAVESIPGRIQSIGELDNVVDVTRSSSSQEISVVLDDTDGTLKAIMDSNDIHQRNVAVYQYFAGLDLSDKFLLFNGKISTPIAWNEGDRTLSFNVVSQIEDQEIGFSAEQGQFDFIPKDLVGQAWPIIFGKCFDVPALQIIKAITGKTLCGVGLIGGADLHKLVPLSGSNSNLGSSLAMMGLQASLAGRASALWQFIDAEQSDRHREQANNLHRQMTDTVSSHTQQQECARAQRDAKVEDAEASCNPLRILGGEDFPQDTTIQLNINGAIFTGVMHNDEFSISSSRVPTFMEAAAQEAYDKIIPEMCSQPGSTGSTEFDLSLPVPPGKGDFPSNDQIRSRGFLYIGENSSQPTESQVAQDFWADAGSTVTLASDQPITYIVSITPGTILAVKAYKRVTGGPSNKPTGAVQLVDVPSDYYTTQITNYGTVTATEIVVTTALSTRLDKYGQTEGWGDELYITFESTIGPNTVDIMKYIIENWTNGNGATANLDWDQTSFDEVEPLVEPFPMNFPVLDQRNTIGLLKDMAYQARCAIWLSNGYFYLKYLAAEPDADDTITVSDIEHQSTAVELTSTEDIITKMVVTWRLSWANGNGEEPEVMILRHNVAQYGTKTEDIDFYCYNQPDIIIKAATFWLIRKSNTWKRIMFKTPLSKLNLETFDCVELDLPGYVATGTIKAVVEQASYNSDDQSISFECAVPVKSGTMTKYKFYWPAAMTVTDTFPTDEEIASGAAGGGGTIQAGAIGELPIGYTGVIGVPGQPVVWRDEYDNATAYTINDAVLYNGASWLCLSTSIGNTPPNATYWQKITSSQSQGGTVFVGGPNVVYFAQSDRGDRRPGDVGFVAQPLTSSTTFLSVDNQPRPNRDLKLNYVTPITPPPIVPLTTGSTILDIRKTKIIDSSVQNGSVAFLSSLIRKIKEGALYLNAGKKPTTESGDTSGGTPEKMWGMSDGENDAPFDFKYDEEGEKWGAGTAFLKDDTEEGDGGG